MAELVGEILFGAGALVVAIGWGIALLLAVWMPYMAWSVTRNIRQIRIQLERLNDTLEARPGVGRTGTLGI